MIYDIDSLLGARVIIAHLQATQTAYHMRHPDAPCLRRMHVLDLPHCFWESLPRLLTTSEAHGLLSACKETNAQYRSIDWVPTVLVVGN